MGKDEIENSEKPGNLEFPFKYPYLVQQSKSKPDLIEAPLLG